MISQPPSSRRRGRPPKNRHDDAASRDLVLRAGLEVLTEKGFAATGLEEILSRAGVPKGSFYHYFNSKEHFGLELIAQYGAFFARKLDHHFLNQSLDPLSRIHAFVDDAKAGMHRYNFCRGCLIGNLGQEMGSLPESFRAKLRATFEDWQERLADCLRAAKAQGQLSADTDEQSLSAAFWIGWEGAVLRAKLERSSDPLDLFSAFFFTGLEKH